MFGDNETVDDLWIGIVPFSQGVNIGTGRTDWLSNWKDDNDQIYCVGTTSAAANPRCPNNALTIANVNVSTRTNPITKGESVHVCQQGRLVFPAAHVERLRRGARNR